MRLMAGMAAVPVIGLPEVCAEAPAGPIKREWAWVYVYVPVNFKGNHAQAILLGEIEDKIRAK